jgi:hypothetical protein
MKSYTIWTSHGEIDNALLEVDRGVVREDNSHYQDEVYLMEPIMALMMLMMILIIKSYCVTSNNKC